MTTSASDESTAADEIASILARQDGVISRRQALAAGWADHDVRRQLRRREWHRIHPTVFVTHSGVPTWRQRAWAAVLVAGDAALCHASALRAAEGPGRKDRDEATVHVAVDRDRQVVRPPAGVVVHRIAGFDQKVQRNTSPPRVRIEHALVDVAAEARTEVDAIATLTDAVAARLTTAERVLEVLDARRRIRRRALLQGVLADVRDGTCSVLEHGYLTRVERAHGLPVGRRQAPDAGPEGAVYRDVDYPDHEVYVELDGRAFHSVAKDRDRDLDRDVDAAVAGRVTLRLGWGQVFGGACRTSGRIARLLAARGWGGSPQRCPDCPD
jgi:hypothetical protein